MADVTARSLQYEYKAVSTHTVQPFTTSTYGVINHYTRPTEATII